MSAIYVWWIGADAPDQVMLDGVRAAVSRSYELPARLWHGEERPADTWDPRRGQHSSTQILRWLAGHRPAGARKVLAITDVDLFIPVLTFVYGEAQLGGHAAVVSTARLWAGPDGRRLVRARLVTESVHELGHTFGLVHCRTPRCAMARSINLAAVDDKRPTFCAECRLQYLERLAREGDDHEQGADADPDRR